MNLILRAFDAVYQGYSKFARETALIGSIFSDERNPPFCCADAQFMLLRILRSSKYIKNTLTQIMHLVRLMWRSASESKPAHSRYSRLSQAWRTAKPIRIIWAVSNWFRRRSSHELNSLNSVRLMCRAYPIDENRWSEKQSINRCQSMYVS